MNRKPTCHGCGLENSECDANGKHIPADSKIYPCIYCSRNPNVKLLRDHWSERWTINAEGEAIIEE